MITRIEKINSVNEDIDKIKIASDILRNSGLVAFPTETVYGLGADALNPDAADKIYRAKGRPSDNPLIVHIADLLSLDLIAVDVSEAAKKLIEKYWPGPLTLIFKKSEIVPYNTTGGLDTVAVRMPNHPIAIALLKESKVCIAAPSANTSGKPSPTKFKHVFDDLNAKIDMIIDGGDVGLGLESTIIDMTSSPPSILRPGFITKEMIEVVIGETNESLLDSDKPKAPGMKYRHYAPDAQLIIIEGNIDFVTKRINDLAKEKEEAGIKVGIIATQESAEFYKYGKILSIGSRSDENTIALNLYSILREFNQTDVGVIFCESFSKANLGQAIMNRLIKASSNNVMKIEE